MKRTKNATIPAAMAILSLLSMAACGQSPEQQPAQPAPAQEQAPAPVAQAPQTAPAKQPETGKPSSGAKPAKDEITWLDKVTEIQVPFAKYPRIVKITKGKHAGELLLTYENMMYGGDFYGIRSKDEGKTWSKPELLLARDANNGDQLANCNIIELQDGRLMMVHQERDRSHENATTSGIKVRYSTDGGETWTAKQVNGRNVATRDTGDLILRGDGWEPRQIQVPHDENGDGNNDIYVFWTNSFYPSSKGNHLDSKDMVGRGVTYVVSYDNGATWVNPSKERYTGGILFRNFNEGPEQQRKEGEAGSEGGMPTPFILPNHRLAFVAEAIKSKESPWLIASDPDDWDFKSFLKQDYSSIEFTGLENNNENVYPQSPDNAWKPTTLWGGAPYASVLPNGKIAISQNSNKKIHVWVADENGRNGVEQQMPFGNDRSFYSFIEPLNDSIVIAGSYDPVNNNKIYIRRGKIK